MTDIDPTEQIRREMQAKLNAEAAERAALEAKHGKVWSTDEVREQFEVLAFAAPLVVVMRKSDGAMGSLFFQHSPRYYFGWQEDKP